MKPEERQILETAKRANVLQVLIKCARIISEHATETWMGSVDGPRLRPSHMSLLPHLDWDGLRITELASRLGVTKQAVAPMIDDLEAMDVVERIPDPTDGRAKLVRYRGTEPVMQGLAHLQSFENELAAVLGGPRLREFHRCLLELLDHFEAKK